MSTGPTSLSNRATFDRRTLLATGVAGTFSLLTGCHAPVRPVGFNFRFVMTILIGGRTLETSSVQRFLWRGWSSELASTSRTVRQMAGEGAVINLGPDGVVVSTFVELSAGPSNGPGMEGWGGRYRQGQEGWLVAQLLAKELLPPKGPDQRPGNWWLPLTEMDSSPPISVPADMIPLVLWFPDPANPVSVRRVMPNATNGPALVGATVAVTRDPLTTGSVEAALPWIATYASERRRLSGDTGPMFDFTLANNISPQDIRRIEP